MAKSLFMRIIFFCLLLLSAGKLAATAPVIGTTTFNNNFTMTTNLLASTPSPGSALNVGTSLPSGWDFTVTAPGAMCPCRLPQPAPPPAGPADFCIRMNSLGGVVSVQTAGTKSNDGSAFQLQSVYLRLNITAGAPANMTITGYRSGSSRAGRNANRQQHRE